MRACDMRKVTLTILAAFIISFSILSTSLFLYHYKVQDGNWMPNGNDIKTKQIAFFSKKFPVNQKSIFIIGSSQVQPINPYLIQKDLLANRLNYTVYNLGIVEDTPQSRLNTLNEILLVKPSIVVYGLGDRELAIQSSTSAGSQVNELPNPHDLIAESINNQINFLDEFNFLSSPELDILTLAFGSNYTNNLRGNDFTPDPMAWARDENFQYNWLRTINDATILEEGAKSGGGLSTMLPLENNENLKAFKKIIGKLLENKISVIIFIVPQEKFHLKNIPDVEPFNLVLRNISQTYPDVPIYSLWTKYANLQIWHDWYHVAKNYRNTTRIYSDDVAKMIFQNLTKITNNQEFQYLPQSTIYMYDTDVSDGIGTYSADQINAENVTATSSLAGKNIDTIILHLKKVGSPIGTATIGIFKKDRTIKKVFGTIDVSTISTSYSDYTFSLTSPQTYQIKAGDKIGIKYSGGDKSNFVAATADRNNGFDGTNSYYTFYVTSWKSLKSSDLTMTLELINTPTFPPKFNHSLESYNGT
jgi:hypothetical protein